jgi:hypothetical protein
VLALIKTLEKKRQGLAEWIKTNDPTVYCLQETYFRLKDTTGLNIKGGKIFQANDSKERYINIRK